MTKTLIVSPGVSFHLYQHLTMKMFSSNFLYLSAHDVQGSRVDTCNFQKMLRLIDDIQVSDKSIYMNVTHGKMCSFSTLLILLDIGYSN